MKNLVVITSTYHPSRSDIPEGYALQEAFNSSETMFVIQKAIEEAQKCNGTVAFFRYIDPYLVVELILFLKNHPEIEVKWDVLN